MGLSQHWRTYMSNTHESPETTRRQRQGQHILVVQNMRLLECDCILSLDHPISFSDPPALHFPPVLYSRDFKSPPDLSSLTLMLRQVLLGIPYPTAGFLPNQDPNPNAGDCLFHTIDQATGQHSRHSDHIAACILDR